MHRGNHLHLRLVLGGIKIVLGVVSAREEVSTSKNEEEKGEKERICLTYYYTH